jgi:hypothetical protein
MSQIVTKLRRYIAGLLLILATASPVFAGSVMPGPIDEESLSIESPVVQKILRRGYFLEHSNTNDSDMENAARLYCLAARLGSLEAQYRLGLMIHDGRGISNSSESATTLFSIAAGNGHERSSTTLETIGIQKESLPACL